MLVLRKAAQEVAGPQPPTTGYGLNRRRDRAPYQVGGGTIDDIPIGSSLDREQRLFERELELEQTTAQRDDEMFVAHSETLRWQRSISAYATI